jgi:hypothetical protein
MSWLGKNGLNYRKLQEIDDEMTLCNIELIHCADDKRENKGGCGFLQLP